jgi:hypothetical protein
VSLSAQVLDHARRADALFVDVARSTAARACPFPVSLELADLDGLVARVGGEVVGTIRRYDLHDLQYVDRFDPVEVGAHVGRMVAAAYTARPAAPIPDNVTLGAE